MTRAEELTELFEHYDNEELECDGATRVFAWLLKTKNVPYTIMGGRLEYRDAYVDEPYSVEPHYWIELDDGMIIDFKARRWLPGKHGVPHGIFNAADYPQVLYVGEERNDFLVSKVVFEILTNERNTNMS